LIDDISQEPDLQHITTLQECRAACLVPLRAGVQVFGLIIIARQDSTPFSSDELNILDALSSYATVALVNQELSSEVKKERINMATAEDHARHWLAREIHDNLAQKLAAITMNIDFLKRMMQEDPSGANAELDKIGELFKRANFDVRTLLGELKPTTLETEGLPAALEEYLKRLRTRYDEMQILFEAKGVSGLSLDKEAKSTLFNIVQESVNNSLKYAEPKHIWVRMERAGYRLTITIQDDGKGFNVEESKAKARARGSHGLSNLEDRARMIDGVTEIVSAPGKGSTVKVTVPLEV
jgi:signal transduction histidine kinase